MKHCTAAMNNITDRPKFKLFNISSNQSLISTINSKNLNLMKNGFPDNSSDCRIHAWRVSSTC